MTEWKKQGSDNPMAISAKRCPQCSKIAGLQASECPDCGHLFRTRFDDPLNRTQAFDAVLLPRGMPPATGSSAKSPAGASPNAAPDFSKPFSRPARVYSRRARPARSSSLSAISTFGLAFLGSFSLVALLGAAGWMLLGLGHSTPPPVKRVALTSEVTGSRSGDARDLYGQITLSMPLYDLQQVAGGLGRVIRSSDPHTLMLSYDYPEQSVRVSLYRVDPSSDDYRVQAVALYHGRQLLTHTSSD